MVGAIAGAIVGTVQAVAGLIQQGKANRKADRLFKQRKAFQTPAEIFDILQMSQNNAQTGLGAETTNYLTGQADRGLSSSLNTAAMLGADPNQLGGTLDSYFQDIFKIGNENELAKMKKFDNLLNATQLVAQNNEAEQISEDNLLKDQLQATGASKAAGVQNTQSGLNLVMNSIATPKYPTQDKTVPQTTSGNTPLLNAQGIDYLNSLQSYSTPSGS